MEQFDFLKDFDWFCSAELGKDNRFVVYVNKMDLSVWDAVPCRLDGKQVLVHWQPTESPVKKETFSVYVDSSKAELFEADDVDLVEFIQAELDSLEKKCGTKNLSDIFYEIHDGRNAVTNVGDMYPDVVKRMTELYNTYGFDVLYNELDG